MKTTYTYARTERLRYIDHKLATERHFQLADIQRVHEVARVTASHDVRRYKAVAPKNLKYNYSNKRYEATPEFSRLFTDEVTPNE